MERLWTSRRALKLHAVILIVVPAFMAMCLWQVSRALGGNELSWAYVFEWPLFAGYAIYMWWRLLHEAPEVDPSPITVAPRTEREAESGAEPRAGGDAELAAYNEFLGRLAEQDRSRGR